MKKIEVIKLSKTFLHQNNKNQHPPIFTDISFDISEGTFVNILGPSGCGKTTLLNMIAGFVTPTSGNVFFNQIIVNGPDPSRTVIFQDYGLFDWKTVLGNIQFGLKAKGLPKREQKELAQYYINLVNLTGSEYKYPSELSGGMKQRASIARAFAVEPDCLLMDEPFGALDSQTRNILQEEILKVWEKTNKTVLSITHNIDEAVYLSDRVIVLGNAPTQIMLDLNIDLERPRYPEMRLEERYHFFYDQIWQALRLGQLIN